MEEIKIFCENTGTLISVPMGTTLKELAPSDGRTLAALVDNKLKSLDYKVINPHNVRFVDYGHPDGRRTYIRSLCFVLQKVIHDMYPDKVLAIDYSLPSGLYCEVRERRLMDDGRPQVYFMTDDELSEIQGRMRHIIEADLPFTKRMMTLEEATSIFESNGQHEKSRLLKSLGRFHYNVYWLDGLADTFYGPLTTSTGCLTTFDISGFNDGFCLQYPMDGSPDKVLPMKRQSKLATALEEHSDWCSVMGVKGVGALNRKVKSGGIVDLINLSEALHERKYAEIADQIYARRGSVKIVFIAGPSSDEHNLYTSRQCEDCVHRRSIQQRKDLHIKAPGNPVPYPGTESEGYRAG